MTTSRHPNEPLAARLTTPAGRALAALAVPPPATQRALIAAAVTIALMLVFILGPVASRSYAASMFGTLRAPGEAAFVAGHRGDRTVAPENTVPAFEAALAGGMIFVETDVRLSADGVPVIMHDATVDRTTNGRGEVADHSLEQLKALDAGSWYGPSFAGTTIPTLDEFLDIFVDARKKAIIELKGIWNETGVSTVAELIEQHGVRSRVVMTSFEPETLSALQTAAPQLPRMVLSRELPADPVEAVSEYGAIALVTTVEAVRDNPGAVESLHEAGLGLVLYTLNKRATWRDALALGVDGIITDKPSSLEGWLARTAPGT